MGRSLSPMVDGRIDARRRAEPPDAGSTSGSAPEVTNEPRSVDRGSPVQEGLLMVSYLLKATLTSSGGMRRAITAQLVAAAEIQASLPCGKWLGIDVRWNGNARRRTYHVPSSNCVV